MLTSTITTTAFHRRYHTGPKLRPGDVNINEVLRRFVPDPVLVIIDVKPKALGQ